MNGEYLLSNHTTDAVEQNADQFADLTDVEFQAAILPSVSRTFALTIRQLPTELRQTVTIAYLLCRIADTIEDDMALSSSQIAEQQGQFLAAINGKLDPETFARTTVALLSNSTSAAERLLVANTSRVLTGYGTLSKPVKTAMWRCIERMSSGMAEYKQREKRLGLRNLEDLNRYCFVVAGVVGEMLTELFSDYSADIRHNKAKMMALSASFGQGLQMTNILKDIWDDLERNTCWLPIDLFERHGYDLDKLSPTFNRERFSNGLNELVGIAHSHLRNALTYTLCIPKSEKKIRTFCIWSIEFAILTLQKIAKQPNFTSGDAVKIGRTQLLTIIATSKLAIKSNGASRMLFEYSAHRLPLAPLK